MSLGFTTIETRSDRSAYINSDLRLFTGSKAELVAEVTQLVDTPGSHLVVTPNVDQVLRMDRDPEAREVLSRASLRLIDGMPLLALVRAVGCREAQRHTGADLLPMAARLAAENGWAVAIVGGRTGVAAEAGRRLKDAYPAAVIEGVDLPMLTSTTDPAGKVAVQRLTDLQPDLIFLCMGFPRQEAWFLHWQHVLPDGVYIGAGAAVDFAAGTVRRAPLFMQNAGLEWLFRLCQEPRRLARRYLISGPRFIEVVYASLRTRVLSQRS